MLHMQGMLMAIYWWLIWVGPYIHGCSYHQFVELALFNSCEKCMQINICVMLYVILYYFCAFFVLKFFSFLF